MLNGEEQAFEDFFATYFAGLYRFVFLRINRSEDAAEGIVQKAMCKALSKLFHLPWGEPPCQLAVHVLPS